MPFKLMGSMVSNVTIGTGPGTFPTNGALFAALLVGVILIVGALTFLPALSLGLPTPMEAYELARRFNRSVIDCFYVAIAEQ